MPIGIVSDEDFELELAKCIHQDLKRGRGATPEVPQVIRQLVAEEAILSDHSAKVIAHDFGVSESSVSAYKHDATSTTTYHKQDKELKEANDKIRQEVIGTARQKLMAALSEITSDKLRDAKVKDVASVAKDMSTIIHNTEPNHNAAVSAQFVFHVPAQKKESEYEVIDVT